VKRCPCSGLLASIIVFSLVPWSAANHSNRIDETWPALLLDDSAPADPVFAALQLRAQASLEKLMQSENAVD